MIGSSSISPLSRATGDEQLLKTQRAGDNKRNPKDKKREQKRRDSDTDESGKKAKAVVVDIEFADAVAEATVEHVSNRSVAGAQDTAKEQESVKQTAAESVGDKMQRAGTKEQEALSVEMQRKDLQNQSGDKSQSHIDVTG